MKAIAALIFAMLPALAAASGLELKGLTPGMTIAEVQEKFPGLRCADSTCRYRVMGPSDRAALRSLISHHPEEFPDIEPLNTLGGAKPKSWNLHFDESGLGSVNVLLDSSWSEGLAGALEERYGPPKKRDITKVKTKAGVEHDQVHLTWSDAENEIILTSPAADLNTMSVNLLSQKFVANELARDREKAKAGAKDL